MEILHHPDESSKHGVPLIHRTMHGSVDKMDPYANYYCESRGPVLKVIAKKSEVTLKFDPSVLDIQNPIEDNYFCKELDLFAATTKGKESRNLTMKNEGTAAIRFQWMRFPPTVETYAMLSNPSDVFNETGNFTDVLKLKSRQKVQLFPDPKQSSTVGVNFSVNSVNSTVESVQSVAPFDNPDEDLADDEKVSKRTTLEFRLQELPSVLLPGQSLEFPIVFRSQETGYFYETLYLLTHPILKDSEGRTFAIRLTGICMDVDLLALDGDEPPEKTLEENVQSLVLEQAASDLMDSVLDRALFVPADLPTTFDPNQFRTKLTEEVVLSRMLQRQVFDLIDSVLNRPEPIQFVQPENQIEEEEEEELPSFRRYC